MSLDATQTNVNWFNLRLDEISNRIVKFAVVAVALLMDQWMHRLLLGFGRELGDALILRCHLLLQPGHPLAELGSIAAQSRFCRSA